MYTATKEGVKSAGWFYLCGSIITLVVHLSHGIDSKPFYPISLLVIIIMTLIALPWMALNLCNIVYPVKRPRNIGELFVHFIFLVTVMVMTSM